MDNMAWVVGGGSGSAEAVGMPGGAAEDVPGEFVSSSGLQVGDPKEEIPLPVPAPCKSF